MERLTILVILTCALTCLFRATYAAEEKSAASTVLTPETSADKLNRQSRSYYDYYDYRYGIPRPYERPYDRLEYARPAYDRPRCGRCDERYDKDRDDDYDRRDDDSRDDDRRSHRPTHGNRHDSDEDRYSDRKNSQKNGTEEDSGDKKRYEDKDRPSGSKRGGDRDRDRDRQRDRHRHDDRDRYRPDYYDRFLRDRDYYRPYYDDRRQFDRYYPDRYEGYGRYDGFEGYRRPGLEDDGYGGYGPSVGRGPHDSFRPWDETYRGQAGWDAGGRGYYFASGRPDAAPATTWGRPEYTRLQSQNGWQNVGYASGYRDPAGYSGTGGYAPTGYRQDVSSSYGQASGWHSAGERRPYRDESGVRKLEHRDSYSQATSNQYAYTQVNQQPNSQQNTYGQPNHQQNEHSQADSQQQNAYQPNSQQYSQPNGYGQTTYGKNYQPSSYVQSSTTPETSYLFQREDEVSGKLETTKPPS